MNEERWEQRVALLVGLTAVAGTLDALAFLYLGKVFLSFQSGNVVFLGLGAGEPDGGLVIRASASLGAFVLGAAIGTRMIRDRFSVLHVEAIVLAAFAALWLAVGTPADHATWRIVLILIGAAAMGIQIALTLALKVPNVLTVALTATIGALGQRVGDRERRDDTPPTKLLVVVCSTYAVCALGVALIPATPLLSVVPLLLLAATAARAPAGRTTPSRGMQRAR